MFQTIENWCWQFDLGVLLFDEVADSLFVLGVEERELAQIFRRFRERHSQDPHVGVCRIRKLGQAEFDVVEVSGAQLSVSLVNAVSIAHQQKSIKL